MCFSLCLVPILQYMLIVKQSSDGILLFFFLDYLFCCHCLLRTNVSTYIFIIKMRAVNNISMMLVYIQCNWRWMEDDLELSWES